MSPTDRLPVSACMIVRDEEAVLGECLDSIASIVREIIVVDTGSTDRTCDIAQQAGARVVTIQWPNSFSGARNVSLAMASQPFIFVIDADERLVPHTAAGIARYCETASSDSAGVAIQRNLSVGSGGETVTLATTRLFANAPSIRYAGRVHEHVVSAAGPLKAVPTDVELVHVGYTTERVIDKDKLARNLALLELDLQDAPGDPYVLYQIGRTYAVGEHYNGAISYLVRAVQALRIGEPGSAPLPPYAPSLCLQLADASMRSRQLAATLEALSLGMAHYPEFTDLYFAYGTALLELGTGSHLDAIRAAFEHCLALGEADRKRYETVAGVGSFRALHNLGVYHEVTGSQVKALEYYRRAARMGFGPAVQRVQQLRCAA